MREEDFDLDLTYITPRVIAMGLPSFGIEGKYRNPAPEVRRFLESRHKDKYMVFNLSERLYDPSLFEYRVLDMGFPDHYAPPLEVAWALCRSMDGWLAADPQNVVAVHCKAGKGRTGVGVCCYLIFSGMFLHKPDGTPVADHFEMARLCMDYFQSTRGEGINYTSQERTVQYFSKVVFDAYQQSIIEGGDPSSLAGIRAMRSLPIPDPLELVISQIVLHSVPILPGGCKPYFQVIQAPMCHQPIHLLHNTAWDHGSLATYSPDDGPVLFQMRVNVKGDILILCSQAPGGDTIFRFSFHTNFVTENGQMDGVLRLMKDGVDMESWKRNHTRLPDDFMIDVQFRDPATFPMPACHRKSSVDATAALESKAEAQSLPPRSRSESAAARDDHELLRMRREALAVVRHGYLTKQGGLLGLWQKRWCVLSEGALNYYDSPASGKPNGSIPIPHCTAVASMSVTESGGKRGCFKLVTPTRTFLFQAETPEAAQAWLHDLLEVHGILVGQDVHNAVQAIESVRRRMSSVSGGFLGRLSGADSDMSLPMVTPEPEPEPIPGATVEEQVVVDATPAAVEHVIVEPDAVVVDSAQRIEALFDSPSNKTHTVVNPFADDVDSDATVAVSSASEPVIPDASRVEVPGVKELAAVESEPVVECPHPSGGAVALDPSPVVQPVDHIQPEATVDVESEQAPPLAEVATDVGVTTCSEVQNDPADVDVTEHASNDPEPTPETEVPAAESAPAVPEPTEDDVATVTGDGGAASEAAHAKPEESSKSKKKKQGKRR